MPRKDIGLGTPFDLYPIGWAKIIAFFTKNKKLYQQKTHNI